MYQYQKNFLDYASNANRSSAEVVATLLSTHMPIRSVVDFGCARGQWLAEWQRLGVPEIIGVDGDYVKITDMDIDPQWFIAADLHHKVCLNRQFDLVESLEVAEHISRESATEFIHNLVSHGQIVLFSSAPPGQGGCHHVNEQPYEYWRDLFLGHSYELFDCIRPLIANNPAVNPWYRYNMFLYVHKDALHRLPHAWRKHQIKPQIRITDISPLAYKIKKRIIRLMPDFVEDSLAQMVAYHQAKKQ